MAALIVATFVAGGPAVATVVCRPNQLGSVSCPSVARPAPRPPFDKPPVQALDRVREATEVEPPDRFIPARRTRGLDDILTDGNVTGPCRRDQLGNLRCR